MSLRVRHIYRFPVKGLSPEPLNEVVLESGECLPQDRRFALARADSRFDPGNPQWLPKTEFVMLMREERLALLQTQFYASDGILTIKQGGNLLLRSCITSPEGRRRADQFFAQFLGCLTAPPRLVEAPRHSFTDASRKSNSTTQKYVSLVNLASVAVLEKAIGAYVDPIRFRANIYFDGPAMWSELDWVGREIALGETRLRVVSPTTRCAATMVNPSTAERDINIPVALRQFFGHVYMGVYAEVTQGGVIAEGATAQLLA